MKNFIIYTIAYRILMLWIYLAAGYVYIARTCSSLEIKLEIYNTELAQHRRFNNKYM